MAHATLDSPVVLVTGAAGGLGRALCECFYSAGYQVVASDIDVSPLADFAARENCLTLPLDVTDTSAARDLAARIQSTFGRLDAVVNNAGIIDYFPVAETDPELLVKHFQVNTFGALRVTHACLDLLIASQGRVLNISSESARLRTPFQIYQSSKLALEGISDVLRRELVHLGVHVATIQPGAIDTALFHAMGSIKSPVENSRLQQPFKNFVQRLSKHPPARLSSPEQVAALVLRAATDARKRPFYAINNMLALRLAAWLPVAWVDWLLRRMLR